MKELSIEQKAKHYDEAIKRAKSKIKNGTDHVLYEDDVIDIFPELKESREEKPNGGIVLEDFNEGDGFYKVNLAYLNKEQVEEIESLIKKWNPELTESDEQIRQWIIDDIRYNMDNEPLNNSEYKKKAKKAIAWLEQQSEQSPNILWHDVSEEPDEKREIFCEWKSSTGVWHSVVFYHADSKTFCEGERIITNVLKWTYVNDLLGKQREQKTADEPRLKVEEGKWYVCISQFCNCIEGRVYKATSDNRIIDDFGTEYDIHNDAYKYFRLWTIKDAKDGDVLFLDLMGGETFIYNGISPNMAILYSFIINNDGEDVLPYHIGKPNVGIGNIEETKNIIRPATKEQRDTLFAKMEESGYEWDAVKKQLKEIEK